MLEGVDLVLFVTLGGCTPERRRIRLASS